MLFIFFAKIIIIICYLLLSINTPQCSVIARQQIIGQGIEAALKNLRDSVDRFDAHLQRTFDEYARVESVRELLEDRVMPQFTVEAYSRADFLVTFQRLHQRLQHFFNTKIRALNQLVGAAEKVAQSMDMDVELVPTLSDDEGHCLTQMKALNASSVKNPRNWRKGSFGTLKSGVHVALDVYKCSGVVQRDFDWTGEAQIEQAMIENAQANEELIRLYNGNNYDRKALMRQYIGTYSGLTRIFPGFHWDVGPEQFSMDLFDPRLRPWFTGAESAPKDVLFLLDFSGSAKGLSVHLIKTSVMAVLQTLSPNDFFTGIWYNSRRGFVLANCTNPQQQQGGTFLPANSRNKLLFRRFLDRLEERDQAMLPPALEESFAQFVHNDHQQTNDGMEEPPRHTSGGHRLVLLFTDGVEFWPTDVVRRFQQRENNEGVSPIRVFGHSIGHGRGAQPALAWLTCQTRAGLTQANIGSVAEIRLKVRAHLAKLSEVLALAYRDRAANNQPRPISWSTPYMDVQKAGAVVSLSMPVLGPQPELYRDINLSINLLRGDNSRAKLDGFVGVAGLDIAFAELAHIMKLDDNEDDTLAYSFLVDNNGIVYFHPRLNTRPAGVFAVRQTMCHRIFSTLLRSNTRVPFTRADELVQQQMGYVDSVPNRDLLELEPDTPIMRRFRTRLIRRQCGTDKPPLEDEKRQLRCATLNGTPLVVGMVLMKQHSRLTTSKDQFRNENEMLEEEDVDPSALAARLKSAGFEEVGQQEVTEERTKHQFLYNNSFVRQSVGILISPGPIKQWKLHALLASSQPLSRARALVQALPSIHRTDPFLAHLSALSPDLVFPVWASAWATSSSSPSSSSSAHRFSASACARQPLPARIDPRVFRSAFLQFRASALRDKATLAAFYPQCEAKHVQAVLQRINSQQQLLAANDDDEDDGLNNAKLRVETVVSTNDAKSGETTPTITLHKAMAFVDESVSLVQIGIQLRAQFFQQKFERALKQQQSGWHECMNKAGRKCLLLSDSLMVLASSIPGSMPTSVSTAVVHLSNAEPELFAELMSRAFIQKVVWRDNDAQCPMVISPLDHRHMQRHQYHLHQLHSSTADLSFLSSSASLFSKSSSTAAILRSVVVYPLSQLVSLVPATLQLLGSILWLLPTISISIQHADDDHTQRQFKRSMGSSTDCQFDNDQPMELLEQCTVEHTRYHLHSHARIQRKNETAAGGIRVRLRRKKNGQNAVWMREKLCNRTIALIPFVRSHLFLLMVDGVCDQQQSAVKASEIKTQLKETAENSIKHGTVDHLLSQFAPQKQVPNCDLARSQSNLPRALRSDLDYSLKHPKELNPICFMHSAQQMHAQCCTPFLILSLIVSSFFAGYTYLPILPMMNF